jgi:hypothetical protein
MKKDTDRYFHTSSLPIAVFLYAKGYQIAGINQTAEAGRKEFAFVTSNELKELVDKFKWGDRNDPDLLVSVRLHDQARQELLDRINER